MNSLNKTESTVFVCAVSLNGLIMNSLNKTASTVFVCAVSLNVLFMNSLYCFCLRSVAQWIDHEQSQ